MGFQGRTSEGVGGWVSGWLQAGEGEEGGKRRSKSLRQSAITADSQNPSAFLPLCRLLRPAPFPSLSLSRSLALPFFLLPSEARLPSRCSYVQLASRLRTEERKTWVLIRAQRGCGSSRRYFTANRLPPRASSLFNTRACLFLSV